MCIIVVKPENTQMPSMETLRTCYQNNPDGAGYMIANGKAVKLRKGFMTWGDFEQAIEAEGDVSDMTVVMHFRIATHGKVQPSCCHPFPVVSDMEKLESTEGIDTLCAAHNGVIQGMETSDRVSDTMAYISSVLAPLRRAVPSLVYSDDALKVVENTLGSKMVILDGSGQFATIGSFIEQNGILYSNSSFAQSRHSYRSYESVWDDYDSVYGTRYGASFSEPMLLGFGCLPYEVCEACPLCAECADGLPYCQGEKEAIEEVRSCIGDADLEALYGIAPEWQSAIA